jgi:hypothetical protein
MLADEPLLCFTKFTKNAIGLRLAASAAQVNDLRRRCECNFPAGPAKTAAPVGFLAVKKKILIEHADLLDCRSPYE